MKASSFFGLVCPLLFTLFYLGQLVLLPREAVSASLHESGPYEWLQFFLIASACIVCIRCAFYPSFGSDRLMMGWIMLAGLCCFYVAGEEISWGQHIFKWATPEGWAEINDHDETNLHNVSQWIDQKPKELLEYSIYLGGLVIPCLARFRPQVLPARYRNFYPTALLATTAACLLFFRLSKVVSDETRWFEYIRISEVKETLMYYFVLLYSILLMRRLKAAA